MRAHARVQVKCRVGVRDTVRYTLWIMVKFRVTVRVRVRSQEAPGPDLKTEQLSPRKAEWSTPGRVLVRSSLWVQSSDKCMGHILGRPHVYSRAAAVVLWK